MSQLATNLAQLEVDFHATKDRPVDAALAAEVINSVRRYGVAVGNTGQDGQLHSNRELMAGISESDLAKWNEAQGLRAGEYDTLKRAAFVSGLANPTGGDPMNAVSYMATPLVAAGSNVIVGAGMGTAAALLGPIANGFLQSAVVTACEVYRERNGPTIDLPKADINDNQTLQQASAALNAATTAFETSLNAFNELVARQNILEGHDVEGMSAPLAQAIQEKAKAVLETCDAMCQAHKTALMTQGSHDRQLAGNLNQVVPRTTRPLNAGLPGLANLSAFATAGIQVAAAAVNVVGHHLAAGYDERAKQDFNNKLNLLYADVLTDSGKEKFGKGEALTETDVDQGKLRSLIKSPAQAFLGRVTQALEAEAKKLENAGSPQAQDAPGNPALTPALQQLKADIQRVKDGDLSALAENSQARTLIESSLGSFFSPVLNAAVAKKYATEGETTAQITQRYGQALHMLVLGSGAASVGSKVAAAVSSVDGRSTLTDGAKLGVAIATGGMAAIGARYQHAAISEKNYRRANVETVSTATQLGRGMLAAPLEMTGQRYTTAGIKNTNAVISEAMEQLALARSVCDYAATAQP